MSWDRDDPEAPWLTGRYDSGDPAADAAARRAFLGRQRNLGNGWQAGRRFTGPDPGALLDELADQALDGAQRQAEAHRIEARRLGAPDRGNLGGHEAVLHMRITEFRPEWES